MTTFRQLLIGASVEDAITGMARRLGAALAELGRSELYAHHVDPQLAGEVRPHTQLPPAMPGDVLIYHASYGDPDVTRVLLQRDEPIVLVYHNLTPSDFFVPHDPAAAAALDWGHRELELIRPRVALAVAVSAYNAADLERYGYDRVEVMPVGFDPHRLHEVAPDTTVGRDLEEMFPAGYALWVSQLLPHKRPQLVLAALHLLRWVHRLDLGLVVAGPHRLPIYARAAQGYAERLNLQRVLFAGPVPDASLSTMFRRAQVFVSTSAHEGFGLPPIEAMSFGVPVIVPHNAALPDTVGDAALVLPGDAGPELYAEAMAEVVANPVLRCDLARRGFRRVEELRSEGDVARFVALLRELG